MLDLSVEQISKIALDISNVKLIYKNLENFDAKTLRLSAEQISKKVDNLVIVYIGNVAGKLSITVGVSKNISDVMNAGHLAKNISIFLGGSGGGGQPTIAQAGGVDAGKLSKLLSMIKEMISK